MRGTRESRESWSWQLTSRIVSHSRCTCKSHCRSPWEYSPRRTIIHMLVDLPNSFLNSIPIQGSPPRFVEFYHVDQHGNVLMIIGTATCYGHRPESHQCCHHRIRSLV